MCLQIPRKGMFYPSILFYYFVFYLILHIFLAILLTSTHNILLTLKYTQDVDAEHGIGKHDISFI